MADYLCSQCLGLASETDVRILPWFNDSMGDYVTTFRCPACFDASLAETRAHFLAHLDDPDDLRKLGAFFVRHNIHVLELLRDPPSGAIREVGLDVLRRIEDRSIVLRG